MDARDSAEYKKEESGLSLSYDHDNHRQRYNKTQNIISHGFASHYVLAAMLVKKSWELGYCWYSLLGCCADGSFVAYLMGISETNPLPPHLYCPKCKRVEFVDAKQYPFGFDLDGFGAEPPICPQCGERLVGDGHNIPVEFFAGYDGKRIPEFQMEAKMIPATLIEYQVLLFGKINFLDSLSSPNSSEWRR